MGLIPCLLYTILCVVFEARVINLCDRDIATNFDAVAGEVIFVDSCACTVIFSCYDCYLYFWKKKKEKQNFLLRRYCSLVAAVLFKIELFVELGFFLLFPEGKRRSEQDLLKTLAPSYQGQILLFSRVFRQF